MASLALLASLIVLVTLFIGPLAYLLSKLNYSSLIIYVLSIISIVQGLWFCSVGLPIWYFGLIPIYFGYISIQRTRQKQNQG